MVIISGGKLLGQGTYGCVFHPSLKCSSSDVNNKTLETGVSKVFQKERYMIEEFAETQKIKRMDKKGKFTNRALGSCSVSYSNIDKKDMDGCKFSKQINIPNKQLHQIVYEHKGIDLNQFLKTTPYAIEDTFHHIYNLLKGIQILVKNKYIHLDLKPDNILITDTNKALLIDFGLGRPFKDLFDIQESDYILSYDYMWYAPEFKVFYKLMEDNDEDEEEDSKMNESTPMDKTFLKRLIKEAVHNYEDSELFDKYSIKKEIKSFISRLGNDRKAIEKSDNALKSYFENNFAHKADVFAMGMVMHKILKHSEAHLNDFDLEESFKDIIFKAAHPNPFKRYTIDELIKDFEENMLPYKTNSPSIISVESTKSVSVNSTSSYKKKEDCMKHKLPALKKMVDTYKMPKKFKSLPKSALCDKMKHIIHSDSIVMVEMKDSVDECMKKKKSELVKIIEDRKLPKKYKMMKKQDICKLIHENKSKKSNTSSYKTADDGKDDNDNSNGNVSFDDCLNYYSLKELKDIVDKKKLPRKLKQLNKGELCRSIYKVLPKKTVKGTVRRGPKKAKNEHNNII